jgi:hypothetical protein
MYLLIFFSSRILAETQVFFSSPCQRQCELLASGVCRPLTFHILIFSSETPQPNELKLGRDEKIFQKSTNQKQELPVVVMFVNRSRQNEQSL